jgi:hypothetical protein
MRGPVAFHVTRANRCESSGLLSAGLPCAHERGQEPFAHRRTACFGADWKRERSWLKEALGPAARFELAPLGLGFRRLLGPGLAHGSLNDDNRKPRALRA